MRRVHPENVISESVRHTLSQVLENYIETLSALRFYTRAAAWHSACLNIYTHAFVYAGKTKEIHVEHNLSKKTYINMYIYIYYTRICIYIYYIIIQIVLACFLLILLHTCIPRN